MSNKAAMRWHGVSMFLKFHVLILIVQVLPTSSEILTYAETHIFFAQDAPSEDSKNTHGHCEPLLELWLVHEAGSSTCLGIHRNGTVLWSRCKKHRFRWWLDMLSPTFGDFVPGRLITPFRRHKRIVKLQIFSKHDLFMTLLMWGLFKTMSPKLGRETPNIYQTWSSWIFLRNNQKINSIPYRFPK